MFHVTIFRLGRLLSWVLAVAGGLVIALLVGMYTLAIGLSNLQTEPATAVFVAVVLLVSVVLGLVIWRLPHFAKAGLGIVLLAGGFMLLPQASCASEHPSMHDCY
jgi:hypothetical protein